MSVSDSTISSLGSSTLDNMEGAQGRRDTATMLMSALNDWYKTNAQQKRRSGRRKFTRLQESKVRLTHFERRFASDAIGLLPHDSQPARPLVLTFPQLGQRIRESKVVFLNYAGRFYDNGLEDGNTSSSSGQHKFHAVVRGSKPDKQTINERSISEIHG